MVDVTAIGELLIDFTPAGVNEKGDMLFARNPGGAPANVLASISKLGGKTAFIGKVGKDSFGFFLRDTLNCLGIDTKGLSVSDIANTTLAFVQLDKSGDRSFTFYRKPGADLMLDIVDIDKEIIHNCHILHFGSVSLTGEPSRSATLYAVKQAKKNGCIISYDPNYRPLLWDSVDNARLQMLEGLKYSDIIKVSEEEMILLTEEHELKKGAVALSKNGASLVLITLGEKGAFYYKNGIYGIVPTCKVDVKDTTGAGDAFLGAIHYRLKDKKLCEIKNLSNNELQEIVAFANAAGSLTTTKYGAISALPNREEVNNYQNKILTQINK